MRTGFAQASSEAKTSKMMVFAIIMLLAGSYLIPSIVKVQEAKAVVADVMRATAHDWETFEGTSSTDLSVLLPVHSLLTGEQSSIIPSSNSNTTLAQQKRHEFAYTSSGSNFYWVGASDSNSTDLSNSGVQSVIQVISTSVSSACLSFWISDDAASNIWGQVGYYLCTGSTTPTAFWQVWNLNTSTELATGVTSVSTGYHQFSMYSATSSNTWAYTLDGSVFGTYNMGASVSSSSYPIQAFSEEGYVSSPYSPPEVQFSTAIQTMKSGSWYSPQTGSEPFGCGSASQSCWGVAGNLQNSSIPADSIVVGGGTPLLNAGTLEWDSRDFTIAASPTGLSGNTGTTLTSTVTVSPVIGFTGTVALADTVSPSTGLICSLGRTTITAGSGASTLSCTASTSGSFMVTVKGSSGSISHLTTVAYIIATADFSVTASPISVRVNAGVAATSTITVAPINGFSGTVTLAVTTNSTNLSCTLSSTRIAGGSATATLSCTGSVLGNYLANATGTSGNLSHSVGITYYVTNPPSFGLTSDPTSVTANASVAGTSTITVIPQNGFTGTVTLVVTPNSTSLSCNLSSTTITGGSGTSTLSCTGSPAGNYLGSVTGTSSGVTNQTVTVTYRVQDFKMSASPTSVTVSEGVAGTSTITATPLNGFAGTVTLRVTTNSTNLSCTLSTTSITGGSGRSTVSCTASSGGSFRVSVNGTSGTLTHSASLGYTYSPAHQTIQAYLYEFTVGTAALVLVLAFVVHKRKKRDL